MSLVSWFPSRLSFFFFQVFFHEFNHTIVHLFAVYRLLVHVIIFLLKKKNRENYSFLLGNFFNFQIWIAHNFTGNGPNREILAALCSWDLCVQNENNFFIKKFILKKFHFLNKIWPSEVEIQISQKCIFLKKNFAENDL
jgi:hypothetical protein